ncbi:hypothetical protein NQ317_012894 [Molorchus minor]|uniref:Uncharacterized protein n=1 Tax=Molorchus minor TaxID=1323400 RepID=A0ABQ9JQ43_9CUCU|nr:hypothetical protein NQ317_012894 [Molorchus minor]
MIPRGDEPRQRGASGKSSSLQEKIATFYYTLGLFCITYPVYVVLFAISLIQCVSFLSDIWNTVWWNAAVKIPVFGRFFEGSASQPTLPGKAHSGCSQHIL